MGMKERKKQLEYSYKKNVKRTRNKDSLIVLKLMAEKKARTLKTFIFLKVFWKMYFNQVLSEICSENQKCTFLLLREKLTKKKKKKKNAFFFSGGKIKKKKKKKKKKKS